MDLPMQSHSKREPTATRAGGLCRAQMLDCFRNRSENQQAGTPSLDLDAALPDDVAPALGIAPDGGGELLGGASYSRHAHVGQLRAHFRDAKRRIEFAVQ